MLALQGSTGQSCWTACGQRSTSGPYSGSSLGAKGQGRRAVCSRATCRNRTDDLLITRAKFTHARDDPSVLARARDPSPTTNEAPRDTSVWTAVWTLRPLWTPKLTYPGPPRRAAASKGESQVMNLAARALPDTKQGYATRA